MGVYSLFPGCFVVFLLEPKLKKYLGDITRVKAHWRPWHTRFLHSFIPSFSESVTPTERPLQTCMIALGGVEGGGEAVHPFPALSIHIPRGLVKMQILLQ